MERHLFQSHGGTNNGGKLFGRDLAKSLDASNFPEARAFDDRLKTFYNRRDKLQKKG